MADRPESTTGRERDRRLGERVPVLAPWLRDIGPNLAIGMLTAAVRAFDNGRLERSYEIHRPEPADIVLQFLRERSGPAVVLLSQYIWSAEANHAFSTEVRGIEPEAIFIHGGPSVPRRPESAERYLRDVATRPSVLVHGEGEDCLVDILEALDADLAPARWVALSSIPGLSFLDEVDRFVRTADRRRRAVLDSLPSPFLMGEFDHLVPSDWVAGLFIETNRGCPYGCTFCDWGSATLSRIRKFDIDRVLAEIGWAAQRGFSMVGFTDANFGMLARDVDIVRGLAAIRNETGWPAAVQFCPPKNTVRHLRDILAILRDAQIGSTCSVGFQSVDESTLATVDRRNIDTAVLMELVREMRQEDDAIHCDFIVGLPGQTRRSFRNDLQFVVDHDLTAWFHPARVLENAPMNRPEYRAEHGITVNGDHFVTSTATFTGDDLARMRRLVRTYVIADHLSIFRHVFRYVQWDQGCETASLLERLADVTMDEPERFPSLTRLVDSFLDDMHPWTDWSPLFEEIVLLMAEDCGVEVSESLLCVVQMSRFLLPSPGRAFPDTLEMPFDVAAYVRSARGDLYMSELPGVPAARLETYPPGALTAYADPLGLCDAKEQVQGDRWRFPEDEAVHRSYELVSTVASPFARRTFKLLAPEWTGIASCGSDASGLIDGGSEIWGRRDAIDWQTRDDGVVLHLEESGSFLISGAAAVVWVMLDEPMTVPTLIRRVADLEAVAPAEVAAHVRSGLGLLRRHEVVRFRSGVRPHLSEPRA